MNVICYNTFSFNRSDSNSNTLYLHRCNNTMQFIMQMILLKIKILCALISMFRDGFDLLARERHINYHSFVNTLCALIYDHNAAKIHHFVQNAQYI